MSDIFLKRAVSCDCLRRQPIKLALIPPPDYPVLIIITGNYHFACLVIFIDHRNVEGA